MDRILHYELARPLGRGKNGPSFVGLDSGLQRAVVIKELDGAQRDSVWRRRFREELSRPELREEAGLARNYALEEVSGRLYLIREYIEGQNLREAAGSDGIRYERFLEIALEIVKILNRLHDKELIHGNLTADNIILDERGHVRLTDPGLRFVREQAGGDAVTWSPEIVAGGQADQSADLYALGIVFFFALTGHNPSIKDDIPDFGSYSPAQVPGVARLLISKLTAADPSDRFASCDELLSTLQSMVSLGSDVEVEEVRSGWTPRQYLAVSVLVLLLIVFWLVITLPPR